MGRATGTTTGRTIRTAIPTATHLQVARLLHRWVPEFFASILKPQASSSKPQATLIRASSICNLQSAI